MRVFELAKDLNYDKLKLIALCKAEGIHLKTPLVNLEPDQEKRIRELVKKSSAKVEEKRDNVIRSMKDLPSISSDDLEKGNRTQTQRSATSPSSAPAKPVQASQNNRPSPRNETRPGSSAPAPSSPAPAAESPDAKLTEEELRRKKVALTEFERQQAKIQKKKKLKEKQSIRELKAEEAQAREEAEAKILRLGEGVSVAELAKNVGQPPAAVVAKLFSMGIMSTVNQKLDKDTVTILATEYGYTILEERTEDQETTEVEVYDRPEDLKPRDPIVTIMGHVDHGKTTLLDTIRKANVAKGEAGGITQHIGAYKVKTKSGHSICFLDTPGHEAFTAMRAHGSQITDIAILVVAADDSVMPQTVEAMNHAKNAGVPIIVAITKMDRHGANLQKVYQDLGANGIMVESWGGKIPSQPVSAVTKEGIEDLLELIVLQAEMKELKANPDKPGVGVVVEAGLHKGKGAIATVLVQAGCVKTGDIMVAGMAMGRVRAMINERGEHLSEVGPSTPVEISGFSEVPQFADRFVIVNNEKQARLMIEARMERFKRMKTGAADQVVNLESLFAKVEEGKLKELKIIVKADVHGSLIALSESLNKIQNSECRVRVIHSGVGSVTESDVMLASAAQAVIVCFHVRADSKIENLASEVKVEIRTYKIIYEAIEDVEKAIKGMLKPQFKEHVLGRATVREVFAIAKVGKIAGCFVESGKVVKGKHARIIRDGVEVFAGKVENINRFKETVTEILSGYECGINMRYNDFKVKDIIEIYDLEQIRV